MPLKKKKNNSTLHWYLKKENLAYIAVCLHFQPERKLNWKTLREKRQRLEDLSDLEYKALKLVSPSRVPQSTCIWISDGCLSPFKQPNLTLAGSATLPGVSGLFNQTSSSSPVIFTTIKLIKGEHQESWRNTQNTIEAIIAQTWNEDYNLKANFTESCQSHLMVKLSSIDRSLNIQYFAHNK